MSEELTIYYSVEDCGDGSAYPRWFDTEKLAEWHQDHVDQGWGEPCTGSIVVSGDNLCCPSLQTKEGYYLRLLLDGYYDNKELGEFKETFFPDGLPEFIVKIVDAKYYGIFVGDLLVYKKFAYPEKKANASGIKKLTEQLAKGVVE